MSSFQYSTAPLRKVKRVQFGILPPDTIRDMSVVHVLTADTYENGKPKDGGVLDLRMGTVDKQFSCSTCNCNMAECPGHFGHIELAKAMFHFGFIKTVAMILRCVCFSCQALLTNTKDPRFREAITVKMTKSDTLRAIFNICKTKTKCEAPQGPKDSLDECSEQDVQYSFEEQNFCGNAIPAIKREGMKFTINYGKNQLDGAAEKKQPLTAGEVYQKFQNISAEICVTLGLEPRFARPDAMVITYLPVPPPPVRPSIMSDTAARGDDDLTHKLKDIVTHNANLRKQELNGAPLHIIEEHCLLLQYHITSYMNNDVPGQYKATQLSGRPLKSIAQRLKGKEGRIRGNLMGKRVDFSARTVITPDPNLSIDEVGVPRSIALNLTFPEIVTPFNIDRYLNNILLVYYWNELRDN